MNIKLKQLLFKNFRGIKELSIDFGKTTNISGENATGKTTIFDGFCWLLFDKDSKGRTNFEVQTLDENNNVIHGIDCNVTAILSIDGADKNISKTLSEKWVKQRGQAEAELKGTTTDYEIDGVPTKLKDYQAFISSVINEDLFKMVTNPLYFPTMKWQDQRKILLDVIGDIEDENIIAYNPKLSPIRDLLQDGIDNFNKRTKASISKLKEKVKSIPYRIDECNNSIVEVDTETLEFHKRGVLRGIKSLDEQIADSSKANEEKLKLQDKLYSLKDKQRELQQKAIEESQKPLIELETNIQERKSEVRVLSYELKEKETNKSTLMRTIEQRQNAIYEDKAKQQKLREQWTFENKQEFEFDMTQSVCPTCGREYETEKLEEIRANAEGFFNEVKAKKLNSISSQGKELGERISNLELDIKACNGKISIIDKETQELKANIEAKENELNHLEKEKDQFNNAAEIQIPGVEELEKEIIELQSSIETYKTKDNTELKIKKEQLQKDLEEINKQLASVDNNEKLKTRIEELKQEEQLLNIQIAELEGQQYLGEEFIRTKVELLEGEINKKFNGAVAFKLFNQQVNRGLSECCEALIEGIPFGNANTAGQINAGLSIIKTLCEHYNVQAPIFIDNRESVNNLVDLDNQIINLVVSKDKKIKVALS